jgi:hypothetical protein
MAFPDNLNDTVSNLRKALQDHETLPSSCRRYNYKPGFPKFADELFAHYSLCFTFGPGWSRAYSKAEYFV